MDVALSAGAILSKENKKAAGCLPAAFLLLLLAVAKVSGRSLFQYEFGIAFGQGSNRA